MSSNLRQPHAAYPLRHLPDNNGSFKVVNELDDAHLCVRSLQVRMFESLYLCAIIKTSCESGL